MFEVCVTLEMLELSNSWTHDNEKKKKREREREEEERKKQQQCHKTFDCSTAKLLDLPKNKLQFTPKNKLLTGSIQEIFVIRVREQRLWHVSTKKSHVYSQHLLNV